MPLSVFFFSFFLFGPDRLHLLAGRPGSKTVRDVKVLTVRVAVHGTEVMVEALPLSVTTVGLPRTRKSGT